MSLPHDPPKRSGREWYSVLNPNELGKVSRVLNGASKLQGTSLNKSLLVGPDLLQNSSFVLLRFGQHKYAVSADIGGMFLQVGVLARDQISLRFFVAGGDHFRCGSSSVRSPYIRRTGFTYVHQFSVAKNSN